MKKYLLIFLSFFSLLYAQVSIMQEQNELYKAAGIEAEDYYGINIPAEKSTRDNRSLCHLNRMVFGWHPYWMNGLEDNYDWDLISDFCYFSYEVDPATGNATSTHSFNTINSVDTALAKGLNVHLCVTLFSNHAAFFGNATARNNLIHNLITLVTNRNANGINIDFEGVPSAQSANFTNFMIALSDSVHAHDPNMKVSMCLYAVDWSNVFNEPALVPHVDFFTIMGYDYYWTGSAQAGPVDPLYGFSTGYDRSLSRSVTYYIDEGIPENKLVLAIPYYGREWETTTNTIPGNTTGNYVYSRTYTYVKDNTTGYYNSPIENERSVSKAYIFNNPGSWRQCWISEGYELEKRYDFVKQRDLLGIGIWALGYDDGYNELWNAIENKLTDCSVVNCTDTIYDGGGPEMDYYDNEDYTFTISPQSATQVTLNFLSFETEAGYDTLFIYDGPSVSSPLIGAYVGTTSPGLVTSTGPHLTLHFRSDGATREPGWMAIWNCIQDNVPPSTSVTPPANWITQDENIVFNDLDNTGIQYRFWNVSDYNGDEWYSNTQHGFLTDAFEVLSPSWTPVTGTWNILSGALHQSDQAANNTNLYIPMNQDSAGRYLYTWKGKTSGTGTNRRTGLHFMCDDAGLSNRGNSYFVYFRPDQAEVQIYETVADVFYLEQSYPLTTAINTWYDYKVLYDKTTGKIDVFVDDVHIGSWQDPTPLLHGNAVSFRTGNAVYDVDHIVVYRDRSSNETVTAGNINAMLRYQNPHPDTSAGCIRSWVYDEVFLHDEDTLWLDVDFTPPVYTSVPTEYFPDRDTVINVSSFNFYAAGFNDPHSGMYEWFYGTGTAPGVNDIFSTSTFSVPGAISINTTGLVNGNYYYINMYASDHAGLVSDMVSSDGFLYLENTLMSEENGEETVVFYPNPATSFIMIHLSTATSMTLTDMHGRVLQQKNMAAGQHTIDISTFAEGNYILSLGNKRNILCIVR